MRYKIIIILLVAANSLWGQDKHLLYNQTHNPQSLMLNPGAAYEKTNFHVGVPALSNFYASVGNTAFNVDNFFNANDFNSNIALAIDRISPKDFGAFNQKLDLINIGWRNEKRYYSAGVYQESDGVTNFPKDLIELAYYGNAGQNRSYDIGEINFRANLQTVFHFGINDQVSEDLHLGARVKLYTSSVNIRSVRNSGQFNTRQSASGLLLDQSISNLDLRFDSTGLDNSEDFSAGNILMGSNYGLGFDLGLSYYFNDRVEITASILDLGFIHFSKDTRRDISQGFFEYDGLGIEFPDFADGDDLISYYQNLGDEIEENLPTETSSDSYTYVQPTKLNIGLSYNFGGNANRCNCRLKSSGKQDGNQTLSVHAFSMLSAGNLFYSINAMYERSFWKTFYAKVSIGIDQFNRPNYGGGVALDVWKFNIFANVDRLNHFSNIYNAEALAYQFGLNLKF
ncbi:MAG: DUF5723 family protein [Psychroflexus sp.]